MSKQFATARCSKPLAVIGLETTGLNPEQDRITKITILRIEPSNAVTSYVQRIQVSQDSAEDLPHGHHKDAPLRAPTISRRCSTSVTRFSGDFSILVG